MQRLRASQEAENKSPKPDIDTSSSDVHGTLWMDEELENRVKGCKCPSSRLDRTKVLNSHVHLLWAHMQLILSTGRGNGVLIPCSYLLWLSY